MGEKNGARVHLKWSTHNHRQIHFQRMYHHRQHSSSSNRNQHRHWSLRNRKKLSPSRFMGGETLPLGFGAKNRELWVFLLLLLAAEEESGVSFRADPLHVMIEAEAELHAAARVRVDLQPLVAENGLAVATTFDLVRVGQR